jgi:glycosyltransferase involved in cell wall biosynthesis
MRRAVIIEDVAEQAGELGIAVVTYSRLRWLRLCVGSVRELTAVAHQLVVVDDGSDDDTVRWCSENGIRVVTGSNRGVAHNKNRGLLALEALGCDPIFLLEDDLRPGTQGWESEWVAATRLWHHLAFAKDMTESALAGTGTALDPWVSTRTKAMLLTISARALEEVGYFDPRFEGWGHEHAEWTGRVKRAGYGYRDVILPSGKPFKAQLFMNHGLVSDEGPSWGTDEQSERNRKVGTAVENDPVFRLPWRSEQERAVILAELRASGVETEDLAVLLEERALRSAELAFGAREHAQPEG